MYDDLDLDDIETLGIDELCPLDELATRDVGLGARIGQESDMQSLQVLLRQELVLALGTALGILEGSEEDAQTVDLHSF